jgi:hypothetical protein
LSGLPGFLGDGFFSMGPEIDVGPDLMRGHDVTRDGWDSPEFRSFQSLGLEVPGDRNTKGVLIHPGAVRFYDFMNYLVFKKPGIARAKLALDCAEQEIQLGTAKTGERKTRREFAEALFDAANVPREVFWLGAQESGFQDSALSPVGALGAWQFMPRTGTRFGVPGRLRKVFIKSTPAAIEYLRVLYDETGDWGLAMAAYNTGEGNVGNAVDRVRVALAKKGLSGDPTFWDIYRSIASETRDYVPAILAWTRVALDPIRFGFKPDGKACRQFNGSETR